MQWTGQKIMFDLRSQIFRHLQRMHIGFFDHNPVGRLVTRLTSDVDALNEMFTSGVFAIFEDVFVLLGIVLVMLRMSWWLALITLCRTASHPGHHPRLPQACTATPTGAFGPPSRASTAFTQEHVSGMTIVQLFNREDRAYADFKEINQQHMDAFKDAILAYCALLPFR